MTAAKAGLTRAALFLWFRHVKMLLLLIIDTLDIYYYIFGRFTS